MEWIAIVGTILAALASIGGSIWENKREQDNYENAIEYNKPVNQVARLEEAGLNPNLAAGSVNTVSATAPAVSNPAESLISGAAGLSSLYAQSEGIKLKKQRQSITEAELDIKQQKLEIQREMAQQALKHGQVDLALKVLSYDIAMATQPAVIDKAFADAGIASNRKLMSDIDMLSYDQVSEARTREALAKAFRTEGESKYINYIKPSIEWHKANTARMSAEEVARHNAELERIQRSVENFKGKQAVKQYNLAVRKFNEYVRMNKWEQANYWLDRAFSIAGAAAKTGARMYGIPLR